jgi:leucyl aminopeptidase
MVFRRFMSTRTAHRLVQQRVQTQLSLAASASAQPATRVLFVSKPATPAALQAALPFAVSPAALSDFQARAQEKLYLYPSEGPSDQRVLLVGLGAEDKISENLLRDATHGALAAVRAKRAKDVLLHMPVLPSAKISPERVVELVSQVRV